MTRYTVEWDPDLEADLVSLWTEADSRTREFYSKIAAWIDRELSTDPEQKGDPRPPDDRLLSTSRFLPQKLSVVYWVFVADHIVRVLLIMFVKSS